MEHIEKTISTDQRDLCRINSSNLFLKSTYILEKQKRIALYLKDIILNSDGNIY